MMNATEQQEQRQEWYWSQEEKQAWADGEWMNEPDKIQWSDRMTGMPCLIVRNIISGGLCGYVGVNETHPLFGVHHERVGRLVSTRWAITYSSLCQEGNPPGKGICHIPQPGEPDRVWWFGFAPDTWTDISPLLYPTMFDRHPLNKYLAQTLHEENAGYRNIQTVEAAVRELCIQIAAMKDTPTLRCCLPLK
jgi:hypothetical protein